MSKTFSVIEKLNKKIEVVEKEKGGYVKTVSQLEKAIVELQSQNGSLKDALHHNQIQVKDLIREIEILKDNHSQNFLAHEDLLIDSINNNLMKTQLNQKEVEIEETKRESDKLIKKYLDEMDYLKEIIEQHEDRQIEIKAIVNENERLKIRNKELSNQKEQYLDVGDLRNTLEKQIETIDTLTRDKSTYILQIEKLNDEYVQAKEKISIVEFERKKLQYELEETKKDVIRLENHNRRKENPRHESIFKRASSIYIPDMSMNNPSNLLEIDKESIMNEIEKTVEDRVNTMNTEVYT